MKFISHSMAILVVMASVGATACCLARHPQAQLQATAGSEEAIPELATRVTPRSAVPGRVTLRDRELRLNGTGWCEWGIFGIDLYRAWLFTDRPIRTLDQARADGVVVAFLLEFARGLSAEQLRSAFTASVGSNAGSAAPEFAAGLHALCSAMESVHEGDRYLFVCDPRSGLLVLRDGRPAVVIADDRFRRLFVQLYLGERPPTVALRDGLLGADGSAPEGWRR